MLTRRFPVGSRRNRAGAVAAMCLVLPLAPALGCAWTTARPVNYGDRETEGVRVYDPKPLLVVTEKSASVVFVPDFHRGYAIQFGAVLSKNEVSLKAEEGTLTAFASDLDSATLVSRIAAMGQEAIEQARYLKALGATTTGSIPGMQGVYEFVVSEDGELVELRSVSERR